MQMETALLPYSYQTESPIGEGGFAHVYEAEDAAKGRKVALKVLKPEFENNRLIVESFFRDPEIVQKLDHAHIVKILDVGDKYQAPYYFAMEYCEGGDLKKVLVGAKRIPVAAALRYSIAIADALAYCHSIHVFHGDIKASNILFRNRSTPVLSDFGNVPEKAELGMAFANQQNIGSPPYLSPEIWNSEAYDSACDMYSLGVLLYFALTGVLPFSGQSPEEYKRMHLFTMPPPPSRWRPNITKELDEIVFALLEKERGHRLSVADELKERLENIYGRFYEGTDSADQTSLVLHLDGSEGVSIPIDTFPFRIGKTDGLEGDHRNNLIIRNDDPHLSRIHGVLERMEDGYFYTDVSMNGSEVNGVNIRKQSVELLRENKIVLGKNTNIVLQIVGNDRLEEDGTTAILPSKARQEKHTLALPRFILALAGGVIIFILVSQLILRLW